MGIEGSMGDKLNYTWGVEKKKKIVREGDVTNGIRAQVIKTGLLSLCSLLLGVPCQNEYCEIFSF